MSKLHIKKGDTVYVNADPKSNKATRIGRRVNEAGVLVRYSKKSGEEIK